MLEEEIEVKFDDRDRPISVKSWMKKLKSKKKLFGDVNKRWFILDAALGVFCYSRKKNGKMEKIYNFDEILGVNSCKPDCATHGDWTYGFNVKLKGTDADERDMTLFLKNSHCYTMWMSAFGNIFKKDVTPTPAKAKKVGGSGNQPSESMKGAKTIEAKKATVVGEKKAKEEEAPREIERRRKPSRQEEEERRRLEQAARTHQNQRQDNHHEESEEEEDKNQETAASRGEIENDTYERVVEKQEQEQDFDRMKAMSEQIQKKKKMERVSKEEESPLGEGYGAQKDHWGVKSTSPQSGKGDSSSNQDTPQTLKSYGRTDSCQKAEDLDNFYRSLSNKQSDSSSNPALSGNNSRTPTVDAGILDALDDLDALDSGSNKATPLKPTDTQSHTRKIPQTSNFENDNPKKPHFDPTEDEDYNDIYNSSPVKSHTTTTSTETSKSTTSFKPKTSSSATHTSYRPKGYDPHKGVAEGNEAEILADWDNHDQRTSAVTSGKKTTSVIAGSGHNNDKINHGDLMENWDDDGEVTSHTTASTTATTTTTTSDHKKSTKPTQGLTTVPKDVDLLENWDEDDEQNHVTEAAARHKKGSAIGGHGHHESSANARQGAGQDWDDWDD